jgi:hypothetical protein
MKVKENMPEITQCEATSCAYNREKTCHALGITVGGGLDHRCDTMCQAAIHTQRMGEAGVGACKVITCVHNDDLECQADEVRIGMHKGQAECLTFAESR